MSVTVAYLDCFSGIAGDMLVGALLDLGLPLPALEAAVATLGLPVRLSVENVRRASLCGQKFHVHVEGGGTAHRHLSDILTILESSGLPEPVKQRSQAVFQAIGEVEAAVHGVSIEQVHFHEVGAEDTIVDVVGAVFGCHHLGIEAVYSSAVVTGRGTVRCDHGEMPVPAPGALGNLLGMPLRAGGPAGECVTPTGAALLKVLVDDFEPAMDWTPTAVGYGAGTRDDPDHANLLRVTLGRRRGPAGAAGAVDEVTCNLDTATGEDLAYLIEGAMEHGAVDAFAQPIHGKKGRPGWMLTALCPGAARTPVSRFLLEESTTLGVRVRSVARDVLERSAEVVATEFGPVACKAAVLPSGTIVRRPEEDEVRRIAAESGLGRREVRARISRAMEE